VDYTRRIVLGLGAIGLTNIQYVVLPRKEGEPARVFVLEVNPRASRTVPFLSKVTGVPMVQLAVSAMLGRKLKDQGYPDGAWPERNLVAVKAPVFSMSKLTGVDTYLGPEMKSTGEVMGIDRTFEAAVAKALIASDMALKPNAAILLSISDRTKADALPLVRQLGEAGYRLYATEGTSKMIEALGLQVASVTKVLSGSHPNVVDVIMEGTVQGVINTSENRYTGSLRDGFHIRRAAAEKRIPCFTSIDTARAAIQALANPSEYEVLTLREYVE
jgi:carbamoyl-phosphate synthase large subunit